MCKLMDDLINEAVTEAVAETTENNRTEFAWKLLQRGDIPLDAIADLTDLSLERVREIADQKVA